MPKFDGQTKLIHRKNHFLSNLTREHKRDYIKNNLFFFNFDLKDIDPKVICKKLTIFISILKVPYLEYKEPLKIPH